MEFRETEKKKVNSEVPWIPTTPFKPIAQRPAQICTSGERNQLNSHFNGEFASLESSAGGNVNHESESVAGTSNIGHDNARTRVQVSFEDVPGPSNSFAELLAQAGAPSAYCNSRYDFLDNQFVPGVWNSQFDQSYALLGNHNLYQQQPYTNFIHDNYQDPQGTSYMAYCGLTDSQVALPPENVVTAKDKQVVETQICTEQMNQREDEDDASATMCDKSHNKLYDPAVVDLTAIPTPCKEDNNHNKEIHHVIDLNEIPQTKPKRRKHRPKVIKEGKPKKTRKTTTPKPDQSKENSTQKRKYVRKKDLNTTPAEVTGECTESLITESAKKTCRRSLYFEIPDQPRDGNSACREENATMRFGGETGIEVQETQALNNYMSSREDAQASTSNGKLSSNGSQEVGSKRKPYGAIKQADNGSVNLIGSQYNLLQAYQSRYWVQFPNVQKKRRSEKGKFSNPSNASSMTATKDVQLATCSEENARSYQDASTSNGWTSASASEYETAKLLTMLRATEKATCDKSQSLEYNLFSGQSRPTKKRSRVTNRAHDYTSLTIVRNCDAKLTNIANRSSSDRKTVEDAQRPQTGIDALVAEMRASLTKKKRSKKRTAPISSVYSSRDEMQQHLPLHSSLGVARGESWKSIYTVDTLTQQFSQLNIYREARELVLYGQNALVSYKQKTEKRKGRRVHEYGTMIPYEGVFDPIKKQRPRPKVDLDEETNKVWKLLMLDINSHGVDGTDEDKAKWWENERNVFRGRAESFIARMHLVQGDRRFSRWKGSVVDSVVGVFLTQNVSDHLSSSAFMSLAARFPVKPSSKYDACHDESASMIVNSPEVQIVEPEENAKLEEILNQSVHELSSMTKDIIEHSAERETVDSNSIDSCGTTGSLKDESNCKLLEPAQRNISEHSTMGFVSPVTGEGQENSCKGGVRKELNALFSSHCSIVTSQLSGDLSIDQNPEKIGSVSDSNTEVEDRLSTAEYNVSNRTSFSNLLGMASSTQLHEVNSQSNNPTENLRDSYGQPVAMRHDNLEENLEKSNVNQSYLEEIMTQCNDYNLKMTPNSGVLEVNCYNPVNVEASSSGSSKNKNEDNISLSSPAESHSMLSQAHQQHSDHKQHEAFHISGQSQDLMPKSKESDSCDHSYAITNENSKLESAPVKSKGKKEKKDSFNWDSLRVQALATAGEREKTESTKDSLDWDAVRRANVNEIADAIKERGMNNMLAERIQSFLNLLVDKHGGIDLEWLRDVPPDQAKEFLLSIRGLGLKSVECVRLLTLHHLAFPVDTNVGRIAVRLGWVPLQPLPESLQLHLLELYPVLESIQKYLWPRLCKLDQRTLYELHYQLITFGKVFCTKSKPNCNACPMRGECRHFASAFASARLSLPGPEQKNLVIATGNNATDQNPSVIIDHSPLPLPEPEQKNIDMTTGNNTTDQNPSVIIDQLPLPLPEPGQKNIDMTTGNNTTDQNPSVIINQLPLSLPENTNQAEELLQTVVIRQHETNSEINICQPIIEEPASPEPECSHVSENDIEDAFYEESDEIPTIKLDLEEFTVNLQNYMQTNMELQEGEMSKALVALNQEAAYIPTPKLKNVSRLRTEHSVYELPDSHCLLEGWEVREPDDPGKYLLAIWTPGETANSIEPPERKCSTQGSGQLCNEEECFSCNSFREASLQMVRGTILIPCRTAMRGSFPLNGTYFQVNEVFADHESSLNPISVPRSWIWNLNRRTVHFGTSIPSIFKGLSTQEIQQCFWRGFVCVRGFDRQTRAPRPLKARLHFPASKLAKNKEQAKKDAKAANSQGLNLKSNTEQPELLASIPNLQQNGGS
ncbi:transcriptional activator DEMETER isoform X2 [Lathyrus oleraceus]|uniref:transcriptional activator DEMETER isoform X2 n=1 Tax=Pisum sativum TaxID=3888 RepID=UPI0021D25FB7|nr:transcriptional activator DEMETER-like isoform X2 [Pisum sativum]